MILKKGDKKTYRKSKNLLIEKVLNISERRDLNPRPPLPQSGALPSCATPRFSFKLTVSYGNENYCNCQYELVSSLN